MKITEFKPQWRPGVGTLGAPAGGDLGGDMPAPTVEGLQGNPIVGTPVPGDVLQFDGSSWQTGEPDLSAVPASTLATRWEPLADGNLTTPALVFAAGDVIMVEVPQ